MMLARSNQGAGHGETNRARGVGVVGVGSRDADDVEPLGDGAGARGDAGGLLLRYAAGLSISQIQREVGVSRPTIYKCVDKALAAGVRTGLRDRYHRPREPEILPDAKAWVVSVACRQPKALGLAAELWTLSALAAHLQREAEVVGFPRLPLLRCGAKPRFSFAKSAQIFGCH